MEQLIEAFGIDAKLITIQVINFAVLTALLSYFLYGPLLRVLKERKEKIELGLKDAAEAAQAKVVAESEKAAVLKAAHEEAIAVAARAKAHADAALEEAKQAATLKAAAIAAAAEAEALDAKARALKESEAEIAKVAVLVAEKILRERTS